MKKFAITVGLVAIVGASVYWMFFRPSDDDPNRIRVSGNIEVTDAEVSFKMAGRVGSMRDSSLKRIQ